MIFVNEAYKSDELPRAAMEHFIQLLAPVAPHITEELWDKLGHEGSITYVSWPQYDEAWTVDQEVEIVVQVNGKIVERLSVAADLDQQGLEERAKESAKVKDAIEGKTIRKVIAVKGKLVNIVVS